MTTERDPRTRIVLSWLREEAHEDAERVLLRALDEVDTTPQRRSWWPAWRTNRMNTFAKLAAAAAAVLVVVIGGYQFLPRSGFGGLDATPAPSPGLIARGTFKLLGAEVELNASAVGESVTGTMTVSHDGGAFSVDLECSRTTEDGLILLAGDITDSTSPYARKGAREVIVLKRGSPVYGSFDSEGRAGGDVTPAASCPALLQQVIDTGTQTVIGPGGLEPIEGTVELGGPVLLGRGSFDIRDWGRVDFEATREGSTVTGRMAIGRGRGSGWPMNVALECTRTTEDGLIMIGGRITSGPSELATPWAEGSLAAIVLKRGSPVKAAIWVGSIVNWPATQTTDCVAYLDAWLNWSRTSSPSEHWLRDDIKGTVEFGP